MVALATRSIRIWPIERPLAIRIGDLPDVAIVRSSFSKVALKETSFTRFKSPGRCPTGVPATGLT